MEQEQTHEQRSALASDPYAHALLPPCPDRLQAVLSNFEQLQGAAFKDAVATQLGCLVKTTHQIVNEMVLQKSYIGLSSLPSRAYRSSSSRLNAVWPHLLAKAQLSGLKGRGSFKDTAMKAGLAIGQGPCEGLRQPSQPCSLPLLGLLFCCSSVKICRTSGRYAGKCLGVTECQAFQT